MLIAVETEKIHMGNTNILSKITPPTQVHLNPPSKEFASYDSWSDLARRCSRWNSTALSPSHNYLKMCLMYVNTSRLMVLLNIINLIRNMCYIARSLSLVQLRAIKYCSLWPTIFTNVRRATMYYVWWAGRNEVAFLLWHVVTAGHASHLSTYRYIEKKNMIWSYTSWGLFSVS